MDTGGSGKTILYLKISNHKVTALSSTLTSTVNCNQNSQFNKNHKIPDSYSFVMHYTYLTAINFSYSRGRMNLTSLNSVFSKPVIISL